MKRGLAFGDLKVVLDDAETRGLGEDRVRNDLTRTLGHGDKLCVYGLYPERDLLEYCKCLDGVDYINVHGAVCHAMGMDPHGYHRRPGFVSRRAVGLGALLICLAAAATYQQCVRRRMEPRPAPPVLCPADLI